MILKSKANPFRPAKAQRRAIRKAAALPSGQQSLAAVYALGIRDGLQIAADIRKKTRQAGEDAL
jgi:hypothetical protein